MNRRIGPLHRAVSTPFVLPTDGSDIPVTYYATLCGEEAPWYAVSCVAKDDTPSTCLRCETIHARAGAAT